MDFGSILRLIIPGVAGAAGALGNRPQNTTSTSSSTSNNLNFGVNNSEGSGQSANVSLPTFDPDAAGLKTMLAQRYGSLISPDSKGLEARGLSSIRQGTNNAMSGFRNFLAQRGIGGTAGAGIGAAGIANAGLDRAANFQGQVRQQDFDNTLRGLSQAGGFMSSIPTGTNSAQSFNTSNVGNFSNTGQSNQSGTQTNVQQGNMLGGALAWLAPVLQALYGNQQRQGGN